MTTSLQSWLESGLRAQQSGDLAQARTLYEQVLRLQPDQADACHLMGTLARQQGDDAGAEQWFRRSLAARPSQPQVWNRLGNLLLACQRVEESLEAFDRALCLQARYADAFYNRARALQTLGRLQAATEDLDAALALVAEPSAAMLQLRAQLQTDAGQLLPALSTLEHALQSAPERAALWHNRAVVLQRLCRHEESLAAHRRAAELGLAEPDAHYNLGNTLQSLGQLEPALGAYRAALQKRPGHRLALLDLARLRWRMGHADFDAELQQALHDAPPSPQVAGVLAQLLARAERFEQAAAVYCQALQLAPDHAVFHEGLGRCLVRLGQHRAGLAAHVQATTLAPAEAGLHCSHASSLLVCGEVEAALSVAERACQLAPLNQLAQALRQLGWRLLGQPGAWSVNEVKQLVHVVDLGNADMADDHAAVAQLLRSLHVDRCAPIDQTLRGGTQTQDNIFDQQHPGLSALKDRLAQAVNSSIAALRPAADRAGHAHPFLGRCPKRSDGWQFTGSWSSRLTRQGFHTDHVHPQGWMSAVYYVTVPPIARNPAQRQGWLRFGVPDLLPAGADPQGLVQHVVQPLPGRLVLFPSMLWHGTVPFDEAAERMTLAFDLVPMDAG